MNLSKKLILIFIILLISCSFTDAAGLASNENDPLSDVEQNWWDDWERDSNHNKIDDRIEELKPDERFGIFINYDRHPDDEDVKRLSKFGFDVKYVYKYIDVICARNVAFSDVKAVSRLPHVVMIKLEPKAYPLLDVSARAIKARESDDYSPNTAFELGFTGEGISIAILDTGVDDWGRSPNQRHMSVDDLDDNSGTNDKKFIAGVDFTEDESILYPRDGTYNPDDTNGHGTHCAGIAMGTGGGNTDNVGVAPQARLVDVRVMETYGLGNAGEIMAGIEWCIDHKDQFNIRVLSLSIGSFSDSDGTDEQAQLVNRAVESGLVIVAAMGNDGENFVPHWAGADKAIAVGSVDDMDTIDRSDDVLSDFSNTGPRLDDGDDDYYDELKPDVVAYGDSITSAQANTQTQYASHSGTSMSTPHVAGVVALMLHANPSLTPYQVKQILRESAEPKGPPSYPDLDPQYNTDYGWGIVDAYKAVEMARGYVELVITIDHPSDLTTVSGTIEISGSAYVVSGSGSIAEVEVSIDDANFASYTKKAVGTTSWSLSWDTEGWDGYRAIYARAVSGEYSAVTSINVIVDNGDGGGGGGGGGQGGDDDETLTIDLGIAKVGLYALIGFIAIIAIIIVGIIAGFILKRKKMYKKLMAERQYKQNLR